MFDPEFYVAPTGRADAFGRPGCAGSPTPVDLRRVRRDAKGHASLTSASKSTGQEGRRQALLGVFVLESEDVGDVDFAGREWRGYSPHSATPPTSPSSRSTPRQERSPGPTASTWHPSRSTAKPDATPSRAPPRQRHRTHNPESGVNTLAQTCDLTSGIPTMGGPLDTSGRDVASSDSSGSDGCQRTSSTHDAVVSSNSMISVILPSRHHRVARITPTGASSSRRGTIP